MLNKVLLQGRLAADPELRYTPSGTAYANFRLAVERDVKNDRGERETDWINVVAWRKGAEFVAQYFHKGDMMVLEGRLQTRSYDNKNNQRVYVTEVLMSHAYFAGQKKENQNKGYGGNNYGGYENSAGFGTPVSFSDEDLPF